MISLISRAIKRSIPILSDLSKLLLRPLPLLRSPLPSPLKIKVLRADIPLVARRLRDAKDSVVRARILDFEIEAYSLSTLMFLHREIFIDADYFFESKRVDPFILDCGSNIGMSIVFFKALYPEARIIGFEPEERTFALLQNNISSNGFSGVQLHRAALGMEESMVDFFVDTEAPGSLLMSTNRNRLLKEKTSVQQVKLSKFIDREVDFLKLDVEGAEDVVFQDLVASGAISKIDQMVVEYHHHIDKNRDAFSSFLAQLEESGFGYQISTSDQISTKVLNARVSRGHTFQDVLVYAYRKGSSD
jgi:FkbM family methyltransferase